MKRLLLVGLVGLSLVGCSNEVDSQVQEVTSGDAYRQEMKERRLQRYKELRESQEKEDQYTVCTIGGTGTTLAKSVVRCSRTMEDVENALQNYSKHSSGAYDSMTWSLGDNVTVTARYIPNLGLQVTAKDGYTTIATNGYVK